MSAWEKLVTHKYTTTYLCVPNNRCGCIIYSSMKWITGKNELLSFKTMVYLLFKGRASEYRNLICPQPPLGTRIKPEAEVGVVVVVVFFIASNVKT